jgi:hypothetical protein
MEVSHVFQELIWHGEDIVRRLDAERALSEEERESYPDEGRVLGTEEAVWRTEVERKIRALGDYTFARYDLIDKQHSKEIDNGLGTELDRWARRHKRVLQFLNELERRYDTSQASQSPKLGPQAQRETARVEELVEQLANRTDAAEYDVALSFAGEDRLLAQQLAQLLKERTYRVFYDEYETARLWGRDLYQHLADVYQNRAHYCVVFISSYYRDKLSTKQELKSAQARAFTEGREYILPLRLDDTEVPGISNTTGYIDLRHRGIEEVADILQLKLRASGFR